MPIDVSFDLRDDQAQALGDHGALDPDQVWYEYLTQDDARVRPSHRALHGSVWRTGDPAAPVPPIDFGCFLPGSLIRGVVDGASRARYRGQAVEIRTHRGACLRVTPNHPVPTEHGLVPAGAIKPGWKLLVDRLVPVPVAAQHVDEDDVPARVEEVYDLLTQLGPVGRARSRADDFHGDGHGIDGEVDVVGSYATLWRVLDAERGHEDGDGCLATVGAPDALPGLGLGDHRRHARLAPAQLHRRHAVRLGDLRGSLRWTHGLPLEALLLRLAAELDAGGQQAAVDRAAADAETAGERIDGLPLAVRRDQLGNVDWRQAKCLRLGARAQAYPSLYQPLSDRLALDAVPFAEFARRGAGLVATDEVREVRRFDYSGHVYDLRSPFGFVISDGAAVSNCRCFLRYLARPDSAAARVLPPAEAVPVPKAVVFASYLDETVPAWREAVSEAAKAPAGDRMSILVDELRRRDPRLSLTLAREFAAMATEASKVAKA